VKKSYYERPDSNTVKVRTEFVQHVDKIFNMAGMSDANPGKTILDFETKLAKIQLTNVELRDPQKTYNKAAYGEIKNAGTSV